MDTKVPIPLTTPSLTVITGATSSGKSYLCNRILQNMQLMFTTPPVRILFVYHVEQPILQNLEDTIPNITFHKGLPSEQFVEDWMSEDGNEILPGKYPHKLIVFDDQQSALMDQRYVLDLACVKMHHYNTSLIFILQNIYGKGKYARTISLQATYYILLKNLRDKTQLNVLGRQIFPEHSTLIQKAFADVSTRETYPYLLVDLSCRIDDSKRLRTNIFPQDPFMVIYRPK